MTNIILPLAEIKKILKTNVYKGNEIKSILFRTDVGMKKMSIILKGDYSNNIIIECEEKFDVSVCNFGGKVKVEDSYFQMLDFQSAYGTYKHIIKKLSLKKNNRFEILLNNNNDLYKELGIVCHELRLFEESKTDTSYLPIDFYVGKEDNLNSPVRVF